ncbi:glycosyltransferase [Bacillus spizizenii]|nr:glycosyltransferase [Bacillus spizizenii]MCY8881472.1 glycosyltransferase [Bacillus spizizenii]MCY8893573.1 glycosyltransferase [Bacillus spizizenii]
MKTVFMVVYTIDVNKGGMTTAMLNRSKMLVHNGYKSNLVTFDYNPYYENITSELRRIGKLDPDVNILNVNDYYRDLNTGGNIDPSYYENEAQIEQEGYFIQDSEYDTKQYIRYFKQGLYVKYKKWTEDGHLTHIDFFNENRQRVKREEFHKNKYKHREIGFDPTNNKMNHEKYFTPDGFCYLIRWYNSETEKQQQVFLFNRNSNKVLMFKNNAEFHTYWLNEIAAAEDEKPIFICDGPGSTGKVRGMKKELAHRIYMVHINHFESPFTYGSKVKPDHIDFLSNIDKLDALVVLTNDQKKDIEKQFGEHGNIFIIPNSMPYTDMPDVKKDNKKVSMFVRYNKQKAIDEAIKAFVKVIKKVPDARLEIFGHGAEQSKLEQLINELNLQQNVFIKGYAKNVREEMGSSLTTLLSSDYEAFPLSVMESFMNGTPVISYDCNYGPRDLINDGIDGYIVPHKDQKALANQIIKLLNNPDAAKEMGLKGREKVLTEYTNEAVLNKWLQLFNVLEKK